MENGEKVREERACVPSHLEAAAQEEDWCQAGMWSLTPGGNVAQSEEKSQRAAAASAENPEQKEPGRDSLKKKKKKKKVTLTEDLQNSSIAASSSERWVELMITTDFLMLAGNQKRLANVKFKNSAVAALLLMFD